TTADARCFFQQVRRRRSFQFEGERTVAVRSDDHRYRHTGFHTLSLSIERFTEFHDVQTFLTQSRTYRWRRVCFTSCNLQLDVAFYFLSHVMLLMGINAAAQHRSSPAARRPLLMCYADFST